jgi:hypothetical protein
MLERCHVGNTFKAFGSAVNVYLELGELRGRLGESLGQILPKAVKIAPLLCVERDSRLLDLDDNSTLAVEDEPIGRSLGAALALVFPFRQYSLGTEALPEKKSHIFLKDVPECFSKCIRATTSIVVFGKIVVQPTADTLPEQSADRYEVYWGIT